MDKSPSDKSEGLILCAVEAMDTKSGIIEMLLSK